MENFSPQRRFQEIVESVPEYKEKFLFLEGENRGNIVVNLDNYKDSSQLIENDYLELKFLDDYPSELDYKKLMRFMQLDREDRKHLIRLKSMKGEIPKEFVDYVINNNIDCSIELDVPGRDDNYYSKYDLKDFVIIKEKIAELISGINPNLSDYEKFSIVYKRVCQNMVYDHPVAYPKTDDEKEYSKANMPGAQNMKNGLLFGKTVCAGYATILRQALDELGIEAQYVDGKILDKPITRKKYEIIKDKPENQCKEIYKEDGDSVTLYERHAWIKVKIDGVWYNCDPTWDASHVRRGDKPEYCLISDDKISKDHQGEIQRVEISGPECSEDFSRDRIERTFDENHFFIGKFKIPKPTARIRRFRVVLAETVDLIKYDVSHMFKRKKKNKPALNEGATIEDEEPEESEQSDMDKYVVGAIHIDRDAETSEKIEDEEDREI